MTARIDPIAAAVDERSAAALVHAGPKTDPAVAYLLAATDESTRPGTGALTAGNPHLERRERDPWAVAVVDGRVLAESPDGDEHAAARLADRLLAELGGHESENAETAPTLLAPPSIPHDAALYAEERGFSLASTDAIDRARARKTGAERERIESAQRAASAGVRRAGEVLTAATVDGGQLTVAGEALTPMALRREIDAAIAATGSDPASATIVATDHGSEAGLRAGDPLVLRLSPRDPTGYRGALTRTLVPGTDGGWERRAHVAVESALRSARTMLAADAATVSEVETELVAEVGSFGFAREATATVAGVGREIGERPGHGSSKIEPGAVVVLEAAIAAPDGGLVALGDLLTIEANGVEWLDRSSRALDPSALRVP